MSTAKRWNRERTDVHLRLRVLGRPSRGLGAAHLRGELPDILRAHQLHDLRRGFRQLGGLVELGLSGQLAGRGRHLPRLLERRLHLGELLDQRPRLCEPPLMLGSDATRLLRLLKLTVQLRDSGENVSLSSHGRRFLVQRASALLGVSNASVRAA
jgi:hypothetical protein